jgi:hypothetical protein
MATKEKSPKQGQTGRSGQQGSKQQGTPADRQGGQQSGQQTGQTNKGGNK